MGWRTQSLGLNSDEGEKGLYSSRSGGREISGERGWKRKDQWVYGMQIAELQEQNWNGETGMRRGGGDCDYCYCYYCESEGESEYE